MLRLFFWLGSHHRGDGKRGVKAVIGVLPQIKEEAVGGRKILGGVARKLLEDTVKISDGVEAATAGNFGNGLVSLLDHLHGVGELPLGPAAVCSRTDFLLLQ